MEKKVDWFNSGTPINNPWVDQETTQMSSIQNLHVNFVGQSSYSHFQDFINSIPCFLKHFYLKF